MTAPSYTEAKTIARHLLEEKLAACINMVGSVQSLYTWNDQITEDNEVILIAKTKEDNFEALKNSVIKIHSYDVPCVLKLSISDGNKKYLQWLDKNCITPII